MLRERIFGWIKRKKLETEILKDEKLIDEIAKEMSRHLFVGRDVTNYVISLSQTIFSSPSLSVDAEMSRRVLHEQIEKKRREAEYLELRSQRIHQHRQRLLSLHSL